MAVKKIISAPDPILKTVSYPVANVGVAEHQIMDDLRDSMAASRIPAIGLAAIQIGIGRRALIADVAGNTYGGGIVEMFNPEVVQAEGEQTFEEGCLSVPEYWAEVKRPAKIVVSYIDRLGNTNDLKLSDLCATVVQHEIDHLNGTLFIDHLSRLKKGLAIKKLTKIKKREAVLL